MQEIVFLPSDTLQERAEKTVLIYAGSVQLRNELKRLKVDYSKVQKGAKVIYFLKHPTFKTSVTL